jgi:hypothetical protein
MLTELLNDHVRELRELEHSRPRYDRVEGRRRSRVRDALRSLALAPAKATPGRAGSLPDIVIRPAVAKDGRVLARLAEASERRMPSGLVLVAEVETQVVAAIPMEDGHVLSDLFRPTGDVVQLLELRSEQLRAARFEKVA